MAVYINYRGAEGVETVDEFDTHKEAREMCREYNTNRAYEGACYVSSRSTRVWRAASQVVVEPV